MYIWTFQMSYWDTGDDNVMIWYARESMIEHTKAGDSWHSLNIIRADEKNAGII